jgi:DNA-binding GntR family transcriptional regulator
MKDLAKTRAARKHSALSRRKAKHGTSLRTAYEEIRDLIVYGKIAPGAWVIEGDLATHLNMSRTPVRGALHQLQRDGFLLEQRGLTKSRMVVAPLTRQDAEDVYSIIGRIEGLCGRRIAALPRVHRVQIAKRMEVINDKLKKIVDSQPSRADEIFQFDRSFHRVLIDWGASPRLVSFHLSIEPQTERYWRLYASPILTNLKRSVAEHEAIIASVLKGDQNQVEKAIQWNWMQGVARIEEVMAMFGERGDWAPSVEN